MFSVVHTHGQKVVSWSLTTTDGLPSSTVYDLLVDKDGILWMGTPQGPVFYDGQEIGHPVPSAGLNNGNISYLNQDAEGRLWATDFNSSLFSIDQDSFSVHQTFTDRIINLQQDTDGLYLLTERQLLRFHPNDTIFDVVVQVTEDDKLLGAAAGRYVHLLNDGSFMHIPSGQKIPSTENDTPSNLCLDNDEVFRFYYDTGLIVKLTENRQDTVLGQLVREGGNKAKTIGIRTTDAGRWVLSYDGVYLIDENKWFLSGTPVSDVVQTQDGTHWFATLSDGVVAMPNLNAKVVNSDAGILNDHIKRVQFDPKGGLLAADNRGALTYFDSELQVVSSFQSEVRKEGEFIHFDAVRKRWLASFADLYLLDEQLNVLHRLEGNFKHASLMGNGALLSLNGTLIDSIPYNGQQFGGAYSLDPPDNSRVIQVWADGQKNNWILTFLGLYRNNKKIITHPSNALRPLACSGKDGRVFLMNDPQHVLILDGGELTDTIIVPEHFHEPSSAIRMKWIDDRLILVYPSQLLVYHTQNAEWFRYGISSGLPNADIHDADFHDGLLAVATFQGIYLLPEQGNGKAPIPSLKLEKVKAQGELLQTDLTEELHFQPEQRDIEMLFRVISPQSRGEIRFFYRMDNPNGTFEENRSGNVFQFRSLAYGAHVLEVYAEDAARQRTNTATFTLVLHPPFYSTPWFISFCILFGFALLYSGFRWRIRSVKRHAKLITDLRDSQMTALRAQMNPHFIFNVLNSIQGLFALRRTERANEMLSRFSDLMRSILQVSDKNTIPLSKELELIRLYLELESARFGSKFFYRLEVSEKLNPEEVMVPSLLIQPYVENAMKHGLLHRKGEKRLEVKFRSVKDGSAIEVSIKDNGVGREEAARLRKREHLPFATAANSSRLALLNTDGTGPNVVVNDLKDQHGNALGTEVILCIPLNTD